MVVVSWGCPPQTRTQETFREKFLGTSKAFTKINGVVGAEFFGTPFYERKVCAYFSYKKSRCGFFRAFSFITGLSSYEFIQLIEKRNIEMLTVYKEINIIKSIICDDRDE